MENISTKDLIIRAARYCASAERSTMQVKRKLHEWGGEDNQMEEVVKQLIQDGYLNEQRYCNAFVHDKVNFQGWGKNKIRSMLLSQGIAESCIDGAIAQIDEDEYMRQLKKAAALKKTADTDKRIRFLLQRGYSLLDIRHLENEGSDI